MEMVPLSGGLIPARAISACRLATPGGAINGNGLARFQRKIRQSNGKRIAARKPQHQRSATAACRWGHRPCQPHHHCGEYTLQSPRINPETPIFERSFRRWEGRDLPSAAGGKKCDVMDRIGTRQRQKICRLIDDDRRRQRITATKAAAIHSTHTPSVSGVCALPPANAVCGASECAVGAPANGDRWTWCSQETLESDSTASARDSSGCARNRIGRTPCARRVALRFISDRRLTPDRGDAKTILRGTCTCNLNRPPAWWQTPKPHRERFRWSLNVSDRRYDCRARVRSRPDREKNRQKAR